MDSNKNLKRWRLILGEASHDEFEGMSGSGLGLSEEELLMDEALSMIYDNSSKSGESYLSGGSQEKSRPNISRWLGDIRKLFDKEIVTIIQKDAIEKKGLKELLFEEETLDNLEIDINTASTLLNLKEFIPKKSKDSARRYIKKIVEQIEKLMKQDIQRAVTAAINKKQHSPIPSASAIDYKMTIQRNIKNFNKELNTIIPEHFYFFDRMSKINKYTIILDIDQSGSMGESVIYSSIMSCILASMNNINTKVVAFDSSVHDLTDLCEDAVDLLYGFQFGGGTDINKSIAYCEKYIETPSKTIFFLISDLEEGGNRAQMFRRLEEMKASGVKVVCLLAIADGGKPYYDDKAAQRIANMGIPCFACTPDKLPELLKETLKG